MKYRIIGLFFLSLIIVLSSLKFGIFWDSVLFVSKMGNPLFEYGIFHWGAIPVESDPGHPPFLASIMALGWKLFGRSLWVSHLMMWPFVFGLLWQIYVFVSFFVKDKKLQLWAYLLVISDATLLSQLVLVNFEIIQLFFFFLALNAILKNNRALKIMALAFLGIVSLRAMMLFAGLFLIDLFLALYYNKFRLKAGLLRNLLLDYALAAIPAISYLLWRLIAKGWIISNPTESWGNAWAFTSFLDFFKNLVRNFIVLGHQITDFGRLVPVLFVLIALFIKRKTINWRNITPVLIIILFSSIFIAIASLLIKNTMGHRYYIQLYLGINLLAFLLLQEFRARKLIYIALLSSILLGNLIVYPDSFAQGWDASLAHIPYWNLRQKAIKYLDEKQIPLSETASFFPNNTSIDDVDLNGDRRSFKQFTGKEKYVFYSNVYNLSDDELEVLKRNYRIIKTFRKGSIRVEVMQRKI